MMVSIRSSKLGTHHSGAFSFSHGNQILIFNKKQAVLSLKKLTEVQTSVLNWKRFHSKINAYEAKKA